MKRRQLARQQRAALTAGLTAEGRTMATRASRRGPIPDDPATRTAAAVARDQLERAIKHRTTFVSLFGALGLLELV